MKEAAADFPSRPFERPEGLVEATVDPANGARARQGCPQRLREIFIEGTEPKEDCPLHAGGIKGLFKRLFKRQT
jgi:membrane carboxypeptidase/penicillin-binding protein